MRKPEYPVEVWFVEGGGHGVHPCRTLTEARRVAKTDPQRRPWQIRKKNPYWYQGELIEKST